MTVVTWCTPCNTTWTKAIGPPEHAKVVSVQGDIHILPVQPVYAKPSTQSAHQQLTSICQTDSVQCMRRKQLSTPYPGMHLHPVQTMFYCALSALCMTMVVSKAAADTRTSSLGANIFWQL